MGGTAVKTLLQLGLSFFIVCVIVRLVFTSHQLQNIYRYDKAIPVKYFLVSNSAKEENRLSDSNYTTSSEQENELKETLKELDGSRYTLQNLQAIEGESSLRGSIPSTYHSDRKKMVAKEIEKHPRAVNVSKELLWGCYNYTKGSLSLSRKEASEEVLKNMNCSRKLPGAWIIGVKKCGSQTLTGLLDLHPEIVTSLFLGLSSHDVVLNETDFKKVFSPLTTPNEVGLFSMVGLHHDSELKYVVRNFATPNTRYIYILVDPTKRALSDYVHSNKTVRMPKFIGEVVTEKRLVWDAKLNKSLYDTVSLFKKAQIASTFERSVFNLSGKPDIKNGLISRGLYSVVMKQVLEIIPRDKLLVIDGQKFVTHPWEVLSQTESFLNVSHFFTRQHFIKQGNFYCPRVKERPDSDCIPGKGNKKPELRSEVVRELNNFYRPYNRELQILLGEKYSWME